jgi:pimeloyl-ACP methyl ester carboxylesterase
MMRAGTNFALLHGGGQGSWIWQETIAALRLQAGHVPFRAEAFDLPGCGAKRGVDTSCLTNRDVAAAFAAELAASGMTDIILVGHSNAGATLPMIAETCPELVRRFVFLSCIAPAPGQTIVEVMKDVWARLGSGPPGAQDSLALQRNMFCNDMTEAQIPAFLAKLGKDRWPTPQALMESDWCYDHLADKASTFVICMRDRALVPERQEEFAARFHAKKRVYLDAAHQAMTTRPQALAEILRSEAG